MKKHVVYVLCMAILCILTVKPLQAYALDVQTTKECSLTLNYTYEGEGLSNLDIKIHRIAQIFSDATTELVSPFSAYPVFINDVTSQKEWNEIASTLSAYITSDHIEPYKTQKTDNSGKVVFTGLETGLYLVDRVAEETSEGEYVFDAFIVSIPSLIGEEYNYNVEAKPKGVQFNESKKEIEYKVLKLWKDDGNEDKRPTSIEIQILKDGIVKETVMLNRDNNWTYTWKDSTGGGKWTVIEKNVPNGYYVTCAEKPTTFILTNTWYNESNDSEPPGSEVPKTGYVFPTWKYVVVMCISGLAMVILGVCGKKGIKNEKNK